MKTKKLTASQKAMSKFKYIKPKVSLILEVFVDGLIYHDYDLAKLKRGDILHLYAQPDNLHDANAIVVMKNQYKLGYIPRDFTSIVHKNRQRIVKCLVKNFYPANPSHRALLIGIFAEEHDRTNNKIC